ncbi:MAG TPA: GNAT family N-acetyltransferase [Candidatus Limnocylindria bacterium]
MTAWRVRAFEERDYPAYSRIASLAEGRRLDAVQARAEDARWDRSRYDQARVVAVDEEDAPVGYAEIHHDPSRYDPQRYVLRLGADTDRRRRGIGAALWDRVALELSARSAKVVGLWTGDATACQAFIAKRGFIEVGRMYQQVIAVAAAPLPTPAAEERVTAHGTTVTTLAALRDAVGDDRALEAAWDLHSACRLEFVTLGRATPQPFAEWREENVTGAAALPDAHFIALDGSRYVGVCSLLRESDDTLRIGLTGVLPAYRRRGIARLLKLRAHAWARAHGFSEIHTTTTKANAAMLALNDALGYPIVASWGGYELRLGS